PHDGAGRAVGQHDRLRRPHHACPDRHGRRHAGREVAAPEQDEGAARPPRAPLRAPARAAAGRALGPAQLADRRRPARGEDPDLQLPREPAHRPPDQADRAPARPHPPGRPGGVHRGAPVRGSPPVARRVTLAEVLRRSTDFLERKGVDSPRLDAERLLAHGLGLSRIELYMEHDRPLTEDELAATRGLVVRRGRREPLAYVLGEWGFRNLVLKTDARALVPRPETEVVVERCLALLAGRDEPRILDVGTGSGAIALALAQEKSDAHVTGLDASSDALALAKENVERTGIRIELLQRDLFSGLPDGPWDVVVSNPPYVRPDEIDALP